MEADVVPCASSYLDLEDPFNTLGSAEKSKASLVSDGSESGELTDDSSDDAPVIQNHDSRRKSSTRSRMLGGVWSSSSSSNFKFAGKSARTMLDGPSPWNFGSPDDGQMQWVPTEIRDGEVLTPRRLKELSDKVLSTDGMMLHTVPDDQLRSLVKTTCRLVHDHEVLYNTREKLIGEMSSMQKKEQCLTMEALKTKQSDENTRKIVAELAAAIEEDEKENKEKEKENGFNAQAVLPTSPTLMHPYAVPPPDPARPPPVHSLCSPGPIVTDITRPPPSLLQRTPRDNGFNSAVPFMQSPSVIPPIRIPPMNRPGYAPHMNRGYPPFFSVVPPPFFGNSPNAHYGQGFHSPPMFMHHQRKRVFGSSDDRRSHSMNETPFRSTGSRSRYHGSVSSPPISLALAKEPSYKKERDL